jgi:hypothetical protein
VFAHAALQVCESVEVLDASVRSFIAHTGVPSVEALDDADEATARETGACALRVRGVIGQEMRVAVVLVASVSHVWCGVELEVLRALRHG